MNGELLVRVAQGLKFEDGFGRHPITLALQGF